MKPQIPPITPLVLRGNLASKDRPSQIGDLHALLVHIANQTRGLLGNDSKVVLTMAPAVLRIFRGSSMHEGSSPIEFALQNWRVGPAQFQERWDLGEEGGSPRDRVLIQCIDGDQKVETTAEWGPSEDFPG